MKNGFEWPETEGLDPFADPFPWEDEGDLPEDEEEQWPD